MLTPKVASNSFRHVLQEKREPDFQGKYAVCLRHPLDRLRSALTCDTTPEQIWLKHDNIEKMVEDLRNGEDMQSHVAPQYDYLHWRINEPGGRTHARVPRGDWPRPSSFYPAQFSIDQVFIFEEMTRDWPRIMAWMGKDPATPMPHEKKRQVTENAHEIQTQVENLAWLWEELYQDDIEFYERMCAYAKERAKATGF